MDEVAKTAHEETLGRSILFTNQYDWAPADVIWSYREQYIIEHAFKAMKDPATIAIQPMYHWSKKSIEGHVFTCVLALFLLAAISMKLSQKGILRTYQNILAHLRHLHASWIKVKNVGPVFFNLNEVRGSIVKYVHLLHLNALLKGD